MDATIALTLIEAVLILVAIAISKTTRLISPLDDRDVVDSIPTVSSPPHITGAARAIKYDIFLSFRGEDVRENFLSHLYEALIDKKIQTFMDHKLHKGDDISPILLKTIEKSEISLIIFSKDYASSTWCMDELVHIMKCMDRYGRSVIPIFYNIDPSNVRKQNERFGDGFAKLKQRFKHNQERVQEWKNALIRSTNLSGWDSKNIRPESKLIKMIVKDILSKLNNKSSFHLEGLVGIDHHIHKIERLLGEARIVGIWGMGGIGKTTLARAIFDRLIAQFEAFYFAKDVRQQLERNGLDELQEKCLKELLKDEDINTYNLRSTFVKKRLQRKKILLVLDDVDNSIAIEDLIIACSWFGEGSRIIITSRDMQVLKNTSACTTYHVPELDPPHALHLFSLKAFKKNEPSESYLELSKRVVDYCKGNPLALKVLGCFLDGRRKEEWESALARLNQALHKEILNVLKLSFDGLDDMQKNVFLDLAFFRNETWSISLDCARGLYGSSADIEISVLKERSLISVDQYDDIEMHALLMEMGLEISRQQLISNPEKPIRLWRHQDIYHIFNNDKGIEAIRCMSLDASKIKMTTLRASNFRKMRDLIFLKVYKSDGREPSKLNICEDLDYLPEELRFFSWEEYPQSYVPSHLCIENLIILKMPNSNIKQFCDGNQHFPNLKEIVLSDSKHLIALPELSHAPKIEFMDLDGCVNLTQIRSSIAPGKEVQLYIEGSGPVQINIGGSVEGTISGLVMVYNYLDLENLSFNKVTTKLFVSGKIFFSVQVKHVGMPLAGKAELRAGIQSLKSLLPFVRIVEWLESPIELGDDFDQHYTYSYDDWANYEVWEEEEEEEEECDELIEEDDELTEYWCTEDEEEDDDELIMEYCCSNSANIFKRVPNSITRWSLLRQLRLKESDISIGNNAAVSTIAQVSILKSLVPLSHDNYWTRVQPHLDVKLSSDTQTSASGHYIHIDYNLDMNQRRRVNNDFLSLVCKDGCLLVRSADCQAARPLFTISFSRILG